ncbi:MAG TPA: M48 family metalloprotease [Nitrospiraceae bacterium]|nr:M48 family metalloprotease [Nitrospiraceae bacterium]
MIWVSSGCSVNPVSGLPEVTLVTTEQEKKLGADEAAKVEQQMGLLDDAALVPYMGSVGQRLAEQSPRRDVVYHFHIVDMVEPNAFALPGGYVYVTRGLLALVNSEDELAGVVGHEIGHVAARHSVQKISRQGPFAVVTGLVAGVTGLVSPLVGSIVGGIGDFAQSLVFSPYSRSQENEADEVGQEMAAKAGWDPAGLPEFLSTLGREELLVHDGPRRPSFFDSHPATPDRVAKTSKHAKRLQRTAREPISASHDAFVERLDGLVVGQRAANGIFEGQTFRHPGFNVFMEFPEKWQLENTPQQVAAAAPDGEAIIVLRQVAQGNDPMEGARVLEKESKSSVVEKTTRMTIGNLSAARTQIDADSKVSLDLTWVAHSGMIYQIAGLAPKKRFDSLRPKFQTAAQSFRPLTADERAGIREKRIRLVKAREGEMLRTLVSRSNSAWKAEQVAVANGLVDTERLKEGQLIKVVTLEPYVAKTR